MRELSPGQPKGARRIAAPRGAFFATRGHKVFPNRLPQDLLVQRQVEDRAAKPPVLLFSRSFIRGA